MAYVRRGVNCELVPQPAHTSVTDAYGNTFENWCVDYQGCDVENTVVKTGCDPQDPDGLILKWIPRLVDNSVRNVDSYVRSELWPDGLLQKQTYGLIDGPDAEDKFILCLEGDRDIQIYTENNWFQLELEENTQIQGFSPIFNVLLTEDGNNYFVSEDNKKFDIEEGIVSGSVGNA